MTTNQQQTEGFGETEFGSRMDYQQPEYKDLWAMILFYLHILLLVIIVVVLFVGIDTETDDDDSTSDTDSDSDEFDGVWTAVFVTLIICAVVGVVFGLIWLQLMKMFAEYIIKGMLFFNMLCWVIIIVFGFLLPEDGMVIMVFGIIGLLFVCLYTYCVWGRIPFASALLRIASNIAQTYEGTILISLLTCVFDLLWFILWVLAFIAYFVYVEAEGEEVSQFVIFLYLVSLYWGFYVFKNVSHTTTCGVAATWYFSAQPHKPTKAAFKRTMTTSFGSVCFGSLLVAILRATRSMVQSMKRGPCSCCVICILYCLERLLRYFNMYAFAQVAIYGVGFIDAAKATWNLLRSKGIDAIINDDLTGLALSCGAFFGFVVSCITGYYVAKALTGFAAVWVIMLIYGGLVGYGLCVLVLLVVRSGVVALFVCFAEDPAMLLKNRPEEYQQLTGAHLGMQAVADGQMYDPDGTRSGQTTGAQ